MTAHINPMAGKPVTQAMLINVPRLVTAYYAEQPDPGITTQRVAFGTSGHRGSSFLTSFNEWHILAISQAICLHRAKTGINGPLFLGIDTHALSFPAIVSALEVFAANEVHVMIDKDDGYSPTPVISHAILTYNKGRTSGLADGVVITPSHNPPEDGGFKYNPPNGGPADTDVTGWIEKTANDFIVNKLAGVRRVSLSEAYRSNFVTRFDYLNPYVADLKNVIDMEAIRGSSVQIGIDPLGGASHAYWPAIIAHYGLKATIVNDIVDPAFRFMTADWDGKIRMDCSSPFAMASLIGMRSKFDVAVANDTDADRHGIVTRSSGLMNPNHYLATAISYLFQNRPQWNADAGIGKTVVSSGIIDRVAKKLGRKLVEVPVGFKWFVDGLISGSLGFGGEESAGASFLRMDGSVWTTDKDGLIPSLLAAEMTARTKKDPGQLFADITAEFGTPYYERIDAPASSEQKAVLKKLTPEKLTLTELAGDKVTGKFDKAPGNGASIGGVKVETANGWFAARPSGTEEVYKIYAESFKSDAHLKAIQAEAKETISSLFASS